MAQRRDSEKQGFCGDRTRLDSLTLMDLHKRCERDTGREETMGTCGISSQASHPILLGTTARQMSNIHLLLLSLVVGTCVYFKHSCISAIVLFMFTVLCVLACVLSAQLWLAEAPERVKQQRDRNESVEDGEKNMNKKKRDRQGRRDIAMREIRKKK